MSRFGIAILVVVLNIDIAHAKLRCIDALKKVASSKVLEIEQRAKVLYKSSKADDTVQRLAHEINAIRLFMAVSRKNVRKVHLLIAKGADVNAQVGMDKSTPLLEAIFNKDIYLTQLLLDVPEIDVNLQNKLRVSPLLMAIAGGSKPIIELLLDHPKIDLNAKLLKRGITILMRAAGYPNSDYLKLILDAKNKGKDLDVNAMDHNGNTALMIATKKNNRENVQTLLEVLEVDISLVNDRGRTAAEIANVSLFELFLDRMKEASPREVYSADPKRSHIYLKQPTLDLETGVVPKLVENAREYINFRNSKGKNALMLAVENENVYLVEELLKVKRLKVNAADNNDRTALMIAASKGMLDIVRLLIHVREDIDVNAKDERGTTALMLAALGSHVGTVGELLLLKVSDIDINAQDNAGRTAFMIASQKFNSEIMELLLEREELDLSLLDNNDNTALMVLAKRPTTFDK